MTDTSQLSINDNSRRMAVIQSLNSEADRLYFRWGELLSKCKMIDAREIEKSYYNQLYMIANILKLPRQYPSYMMDIE